MELLPSFGVNSVLSRDEFVRRLRCENSAEQVRSLRQLLFLVAVRLNLADDGDVLVRALDALLLNGVTSRLLVILPIQFLLEVVQCHLGSQDLTLTSRAGTVVACHLVCLTLRV